MKEPFSIIIKKDVLVAAAIIETRDEYDEFAMGLAIAATAFFDAMRSSDSDGSPKGGDAKQGSVEDDSAVAKPIAQDEQWEDSILYGDTPDVLGKMSGDKS